MSNGRGVGMLRALGDVAQRLGLAAKLGETFGGERDLYTTFGYRRTPKFDDYLSYYMRGDIAARIIDVPTKATWRHAPEVGAEDDGAFAQQVLALDDRLRLFHYMQRVDEISGIGQYGVLLLGTVGTTVDQEPGTLRGVEDIAYLRAFHQGSVDIKEWELDTTSPRYGKPKMYEIDLAGTTLSSSADGGGGGNAGSRKAEKRLVPWQRVIHVAENTVEDDVYGQPRLARVLNRVDDLFKVLGSSAELFWQNVGGVWHANISPDVDVSAEDLAAFEDDIIAARQGLNRLIQTRGVELDAISGAPPSPAGIYDALIQVICATAEIPARVLMGSERGQLASDQDQREWQARVASRQEQFAEPMILRATLDRLIDLGAIKVPATGYWVSWPPLDAPSTSDRADIAQKFANAIKALAPEGATDFIMPPWEMREFLLGLDAVPPEAPDTWDYGFGSADVGMNDEQEG